MYGRNSLSLINQLETRTPPARYVRYFSLFFFLQADWCQVSRATSSQLTEYSITVIINKARFEKRPKEVHCGNSIPGGATSWLSGFLSACAVAITMHETAISILEKMT